MPDFKLTNPQTGWDEGHDYGQSVPPLVIIAFDAECSECKRKFHATRFLMRRPADADIPNGKFALMPASAFKMTCVTRGCQTNIFLAAQFE